VEPFRGVSSSGERCEVGGDARSINASTTNIRIVVIRDGKDRSATQCLFGSPPVVDEVVSHRCIGSARRILHRGRLAGARGGT
jgi:hypothetical protein